VTLYLSTGLWFTWSYRAIDLIAAEAGRSPKTWL
jgi:hypothetical protein